MKRKYLITGQEVLIDSETETHVFCRCIYVHDEYEHEGSEILKVDKAEVFDTPPVEKISYEIAELLNKEQSLIHSISLKSKELNDTERKIQQNQKTIIDNEKFIINRSELKNAKALVLFSKDKIDPIMMDSKDKSFSGLKLSLNISIIDGKEKSWGYKIYQDSSDSCGDYLCEKYGILVNPTQEEINDVAQKRVQELNFGDWAVMRASDKYLTPELLQKKKELAATEKTKQRENIERQISTYQKQLESLA